MQAVKFVRGLLHPELSETVWDDEQQVVLALLRVPVLSVSTSREHQCSQPRGYVLPLAQLFLYQLQRK